MTTNALSSCQYPTAGLLQELKLAHHYGYALSFLYNQNLFSSQEEIYIVAFLFSMEESGSIATPLQELKPLLKKYLSALPDTDLIEKVLNFSDQFFKNSKLVSSDVSNETPFVLCNQLVYSRRAYLFEQQLLATVASHLLPRTVKISIDDKAVLNYLNRSATLNILVSRAVNAVLSSNFLILTGGPGFGKTTALATLLEALLFIQPDLDKQSYSMALAAPTGRAASRMMESLASNQQFTLLKQHMPTNALTLHRLLGFNALKNQCYYNADRPLSYDVIAIDEGSMVDAPFFNHLLKALKPSCKLILLGDANQLPSIGSGAILEDLMMGSKEETHLLHHNIVELTTCYRSDQTILALANAALSGQLPVFNQMLDDGHSSFIVSQNIMGVAKLVAQLNKFYSFDHLPSSNYFKNDGTTLSSSEQAAIQQFFDFYNNFIVLTPLRQGSSCSADELNKALNRLKSPYESYHGQPIIITTNDDLLALSNGDRGVIIKLPNAFFAFFEGRAEPVLLSRIANWQTAYAITIHKSQGSEFNQAAIIIPPHSGRVLSRKLLYTAITRAKTRLYFFKNDDEIALALANQHRRYSSLPTFLQPPS